jgi:hypothetical protein
VTGSIGRRSESRSDETLTRWSVRGVIDRGGGMTGVRGSTARLRLLVTGGEDTGDGVDDGANGVAVGVAPGPLCTAGASGPTPHEAGSAKHRLGSWAYAGAGWQVDTATNMPTRMLCQAVGINSELSWGIMFASWGR